MSKIDVLIICALRQECDALRACETGIVDGWTPQPGDPDYWTATLDGAAGPIHVATTWATAMAGVPTAELATRMTMQLKPRSLAMCGVCAGHPDDTDLGDVIIADRVFQHDNGKLTDDGFRGDLTTHLADDRWVRAAQALEGAATGMRGYDEPTPEAAKWWFLERLYTKRHPRKSAYGRYFPRETRAAQLETLEVELVRLEGEVFSLTDAGHQAAARRRVLHGGAPAALPFHIHVGPMGSGNSVIASHDEWDRITGQGMRKVVGIEMEAAAVGAVAYRHCIPFVVAKGVMDHGDGFKADGFKGFAARASAEVLCDFLRRVVKPATESDSARTPRTDASSRSSQPEDPAKPERAPKTSVISNSHQSGGINFSGATVNVGGDIVGGDKHEVHHHGSGDGKPRKK